MAAVPLTDEMLQALADACTVVATLEAVGHGDPDVHRPPCGWRQMGAILRANLPMPGDDRTGDGQVGHGPGFVVLDLHRVDPTAFTPGHIAQVAPSQARQIGKALYHQADDAEALLRRGLTPRT